MKRFYSYVIGIGKDILQLKKDGFRIKKSGLDYWVEFAEIKSDIWENFVKNKLPIGYWNEYIADDKVVFLFHLENGFKRFVVYDFEDDEVLRLCEKLCECKFKSIKSMLENNKFYNKILRRNR